MYAVATTHLGRLCVLYINNNHLIPLTTVLAAFRFYKSIFLNVDPKGSISYLRNLNHWEYLGLISLLCIQTWLGDMLVVSEEPQEYQFHAHNQLRGYVGTTLPFTDLVDLPVLCCMEQQPLAHLYSHLPTVWSNW